MIDAPTPCVKYVWSAFRRTLMTAVVSAFRRTKSLKVVLGISVRFLFPVDRR